MGVWAMAAAAATAAGRPAAAAAASIWGAGTRVRAGAPSRKYHHSSGRRSGPEPQRWGTTGRAAGLRLNRERPTARRARCTVVVCAAASDEAGCEGGAGKKTRTLKIFSVNDGEHPARLKLGGPAHFLCLPRYSSRSPRGRTADSPCCTERPYQRITPPRHVPVCGDAVAGAERCGGRIPRAWPVKGGIFLRGCRGAGQGLACLLGLQLW